MSENKFIKHLRGEQTAKSVLELKNQRAKTSFANMPHGTSNGDVVYSDHRGNATAVLKGTDNWKLNGSSLVVPTEVYGDGRDVTGTYDVAGQTLWVDASYTFTDPKLFTPNTKWVLKLCGNRLMSMTGGTIPLTMLIKFGAATVVTKAFTIKEHAFNFSEELVIDFAESNANNIKVAANNTMTVQVLCGDATATAQIYNGMTVFTALQRRVDGDAVASDEKTFDDVVDDVEQLQEDLDDLEEYVDETFVKKAGDTMSGTLHFQYYKRLQFDSPYTGVYGYFSMNSAGVLSYSQVYNNGNTTLTYTFNYYNGGIHVTPSVDNKFTFGTPSYRFNTVCTKWLQSDGAACLVPSPAQQDVLATKSDVDLAANSGRMITDQGVWFAKMYAATVVPTGAEYDGKNYADFSQVDADNNPVIKIYTGASGAWTLSETITPPAEYDGYVPITSKIWDIAEQENQQGGRVMWNHQSKEFTPYPLIVDISYLIDEIDTKQDKLIAGDNITIARLVPDGYDVLEYIESDGTQYINTLVPVNISNSFDIDCVLLSGNSDAHLISEGNVSIRVGANAFTWYTQSAHYLSTFTPGDNYNIQCGLNYLVVNGNTINGTTDSDNVSGTSVYLLARNTVASQCKARIKHIKIYDANSDLAFDGTPAIRNADGVVGLYDSVSGTFFANSDAGASNFIAGSKIASTVISSTADPLPDQTGHAGEFLSTDGTDVSWQAINASGYHPDLFDWKWADHQVNDVQWLRADTFSWQSGSVYPAAYKHLRNDMYNWYSWTNNGTTIYTKKAYPEVGEKVYSDSALTTEVGEITEVTDTLDITVEKITVNGVVYDSVSGSNIAPTTETVGGVTVQYIPAEDGHKIVTDFHESEVADAYAATGVAWYYIIDYGSKRFKLPRTKYGVTGLRDTVGNYVPESLPAINIKTTGTGDNNNLYHTSKLLSEDGSLARGTDHDNPITQTLKTTGSTTYQDDAPVQQRATQMYLYFYVGEFTQTALENTAGITAETLNDKVDVGHQVIEFQAPTAGNNYTWYRKYADGWVEQGGYVSTAFQDNTTVSLAVTMADTHYHVNAIAYYGTASQDGANVYIYDVTTSSISISNKMYGGNATVNCYWEVKGMMA